MNPSASFHFKEDDDEDENTSPRRALPASSIQTSPMQQNPMDILCKGYMNRLETQPVLTKAITCSIVSALGALMDILWSAGKKRTNRQRTTPLEKLSQVCAFALYGGFVGGPMSHYWNAWLDESVDLKKYSTSWGLLVDQLILQPPTLFLMHVVLDMAGAAVHELPRAWKRAAQRTGSSIVSSWSYWPAMVYIILYLARKKRHAIIAIQLASVYWMSKVAKQRAETLPFSTH